MTPAAPKDAGAVRDGGAVREADASLREGDAAPAPLDVLIVGGGLVGGSVGALLQRGARAAGRPLAIGILERSRPQRPAADAPLDVRVSALSRASERILGRAAAWESIAGPRTAPCERMRVWHRSTAAGRALTFDAADVGEPNLGIIVENRLVQAAVVDAFEAAGGRLVLGSLESLEPHDDSIEARTSAGRLRARLVVGADGARSTVRDALGVTADTASYQQTAIAANVATERPHARTAYQRFLGNGTLAFLPLAGGASSIVWSADADVAAGLLAASPEEFEQELGRQIDGALGAVRLITERVSFPLRRLAAHRYTAHRCALVGDAAHAVHPLAGQGANLGLLDAASLAQVVIDGVAEGEDPGAERVLRRYERWRKSETQPMAAAIDAFDRWLAHGSGPVARTAQRGLTWVDRSRPLKRVLMARALGLTGELPRAARRGP